MDTKTLVAEAKARFNHNSAKAYLQEKYTAKLLVAEQGGLWRADSQTIGFLNAMTDEQVVLVDTFNNPVLVERIALLRKLQETYNLVTQEWHQEWRKLENKR